VSRFASVPASTRPLMVAGAIVFAAAAVWLLVTGAADHGSVWAAPALVLVSGLTVGACWMVSARRPVLVPAIVVGVATALILADPGSFLHYSALLGPFGYANATAAFFAQAAVAAVMLAAVSRWVPARVAGVVGTVVFVSVVAVTRSWTAIVLLPSLILLALALTRARGSRTAVAVCGCLAGAVLTATILIGAWGGGSGGGTVDRIVRSTISEDRVALWHDALTIVAREPFLGVGVGGFATTSDTASADLDLRWAHNEFLQTAAEAGLVGFVLLIAVFVWGFYGLWAAPSHVITALAAAALALLAIHASVDHVLRVPGVALVGSAVLGVGLGASEALKAAAPRLASTQRTPAGVAT
jgi:O-antigen ligase